MAFLAPKLVLTPLLITSASLAGRRWGAITSGWLLALPLTSGPIALFIALDLGARAGAQAAAGSLAGATGQVAFAPAYALAGERLSWPGCLVVASLAFAAVAAAIPPADPAVLALIALGAIVLGLGAPVLRPRQLDAALPGIRREAGRWDIPARAVVATTLVLAISAAAPIVGGHAAGILATFPVYISVLTTFAHRIGGPSQARGVLRGLILGLPGFVAFFLAVGALIESLGIWAAFAIALGAAILLNIAILTMATRWGSSR